MIVNWQPITGRRGSLEALLSEARSWAIGFFLLGVGATAFLAVVGAALSLMTGPTP